MTPTHTARPARLSTGLTEAATQPVSQLQLLYIDFSTEREQRSVHLQCSRCRGAARGRCPGFFISKVFRYFLHTPFCKQRALSVNHFADYLYRLGF